MGVGVDVTREVGSRVAVGGVTGVMGVMGVMGLARERSSICWKTANKRRGEATRSKITIMSEIFCEEVRWRQCFLAVLR